MAHHGSPRQDGTEGRPSPPRAPGKKRTDSHNLHTNWHVLFDENRLRQPKILPGAAGSTTIEEKTMRYLTSKILYLSLGLLLIPGLGMAQLPDPGLVVDRSNTAVVITDPQNDFLSPEGVTWGLVGASVEEARGARR